ncbi:MAG: sulfurtransferase [Lutibacter sp.]|nr:sulfurtransferase [Lutibacter sp.]
MSFNLKMNPIVSTAWLYENLENPNLVILDASPRENKSNLMPEFTNIQIKGALQFDMEKVFLDKENPIPNMMPNEKVFEDECQKLGINKESFIVVYDNLGVYTSPRVWWMFKAMGHDEIAVLDGGLSAWKNANLPTELLGNTETVSGNFKAKYQSDLVVDSTFLLENIESKKMLVVDARSAERFSGLIPEPRENMSGGHIPNSINLPFEKVLHQGKMKPKEELKEIFKNLNIENKPLAFTCGSGITACIILLASELISEKNKNILYDGSWSEWGQSGKFPVEK